MSSECIQCESPPPGVGEDDECDGEDADDGARPDRVEVRVGDERPSQRVEELLPTGVRAAHHQATHPRQLVPGHIITPF